MNNNEQNQKKELKKLPGFYIALCCCVLVIGLAGYFTERRGQNSTDRSNDLAENQSVFSGDIDSYTDEAVDRNAVPASETVTDEEYAAETAEKADAEAVQAETTDETAPAEAAPVYSADASEEASAPVYTEEYEIDNPDVADTAVIVSAESAMLESPVSGAVLETFSDKLVYNSAMDDWRTHDGIDLAADVGCSVHAAANGTVTSIFSDATGEGVEIEHESGLKTRYMGLKSVESLSEGDSVAAGDVIGLIGESKGEKVTEPHLHFEVYKDGIAVNPSEFM